MKKAFLTLATICIILTACGEQKNIPTVYPSVTPEPSLTATATLTRTPTIVATLTKILPTQPPPPPTFTPFPAYALKKVVFEYSTSGNFWAGDAAYFASFDNHVFIQRPLILYDDGQMITYNGQKVLSADEMKKFFSKLEALGFFSLESNGMHDDEDKLYNFGNQYEKSFDGLRDCISVNIEKTRTLCAYDEYMQFLVPEMKNILKYFSEYKPTGLTPYYPDRILLSTRPANPDTDDLSVNARIWDKRFPLLAFTLQNRYNIPVTIRYIQGDMAKEIDRFMQNSHSHGVFIEDGKKYIVDYVIVLPDEELINAYQ